MINFLKEGLSRQTDGEIRLKGLSHIPAIIQNLELAFPDDRLPLSILPLLPQNHQSVYERIEKDYKGLCRRELSKEQMSMVVFDSYQITDEALLYFLPTILAGILDGRCLHTNFLRKRLLKIRTVDKILRRNLSLIRIALIEIEKILRLLEKDDESVWQNGA